MLEEVPLFKRKICYGTFVTADNLKRCSKCGFAYYVDVDVQRQNWQFHKKFCEKVDQSYIDSLPLRDIVKNCLDVWSVNGGGPKGPFQVTSSSALYFERLLKDIRKERTTKGFDFENESGMELGDLGFAFHVRVFETETKLINLFNLFYAIPGMPQLLLTTNMYNTSRLLGKPKK
jgi:hypothetical protein